MGAAMQLELVAQDGELFPGVPALGLRCQEQLVIAADRFDQAGGGVKEAAGEAPAVLLNIPADGAIADGKIQAWLLLKRSQPVQAVNGS